MTDASSAPPVVVVLVTSDAGPWFAETLASVAAQDYPRLAVLVLDNAGDVDPTPLVAEHLPGAALRRLDDDLGYGAAANRVGGLVEGATFYLFCHDDIVLAPDAVSVMVAEAVRGNAGVVGPKQVRWNEPDRLVAVGASVDRIGVAAPLVEEGELDQEQHDRVRDVMWVPGGAILVRADLFAELGGFDEAITYLGEDLDLCWRSQVAGARVVVAPDAVVRHLQALGERRPDDRRRLQSRHRLRTVLGVTSWLRLLWLVPLALLFTGAEALYALAAGRPSHARDVVSGWTWNLGRLRSLRSKRRAVARVRKVSDGEIRHLQVQGSSRVKAFVRGQINRGDRLTALGDAGRSLASSLTVGGERASAAAWASTVVVFVTLLRHLITRGVPALGEMSMFPTGEELRSVVTSGLRDSWLGTAAGRPLGPGLLGLADLAPLTTPALRTLLILGPVFVGLVGSWRLAGPLRSRRASMAALLLAASSPLPAAALVHGSWTLLVCWASLPWILARLARFGRLEPFADGSGLARSGTERPPVSQLAGLGLLLAVVGAFAPVIVPLTLLLAFGLLIGSVLVGAEIAGATRAMVGAVAASALAAVLHLPTIIGWLQDAPPARHLLGRLIVEDIDGLGALVRADVGPVGHPVAGWAGAVLVTVVVFLGSGWRVSWAARALVIIAMAVGVAWATARGWMPVVMPDPLVVLAVASPLFSMGAALAAVVYERDLALYRFGWRQPLLTAGVVALIVAPLPVLAQLADGRWGVPGTAVVDAVGFIDDGSDDGRVLWLGRAETLPVPGIELVSPEDDDAGVGVQAAVTVGVPDVIDQWPATSVAATAPIRRDLLGLISGSTARIGQQLGRSGVRYIVVVNAALPSFEESDDDVELPVGGDVVDRLEQQLDLRLVSTDSAVVVFENRAWLPVDAVLPPVLAEAARTGDGSALADRDAVDEVGPAAAAVVGPGEAVYSSRRPADRFRVLVDGESVETVVGFGVGVVGADDRTGVVEVRATGAPERYRWELIGLAMLWLLVWWLSIRGLGAEGRALRSRLLDEAERADPISGAGEDAVDGGRSRRGRRWRSGDGDRTRSRFGRNRAEEVVP